MKVFSNSTPKDLVRNGIYKNLNNCPEVFIETPFFSYSELVEDILKTGAFVRLVVRLGPATSASSLAKIYSHPNIHIRYFTSSSFHSKLYIFSDRTCLVGSANLTQAGMNTNKEICIEISSEEESFDSLTQLFQSYWNDAEPLTQKLLEDYKELERSNPPQGVTSLEKGIQIIFGNVEPSGGIDLSKPKKSKEHIFLSSYQRTYQEFRTAFDEVRKLYEADGRRQQPEESVPLRIEIDQFFSFIREKFTKGENYLDQPLRKGEERISFVKEHIVKWFDQRWSYLDDHIPAHYPRINSVLSSKAGIDKAAYDEILDALDVCHSFHERLRFFKGGHETHIKVFREANDLKRVKELLKYLIHGNDDYVTRMGNCIFNPDIYLKEFGRSAVQELIGWVNKDGIPICNSRTVKALRYLGYDIKIFS